MLLCLMKQLLKRKIRTYFCRISKEKFPGNMEGKPRYNPFVKLHIIYIEHQQTNFLRTMGKHDNKLKLEFKPNGNPTTIAFVIGLKPWFYQLFSSMTSAVTIGVTISIYYSRKAKSNPKNPKKIHQQFIQENEIHQHNEILITKTQ